MVNRLLDAIVADANLLQAWVVSEARLGEESVPHAEVMAFRDGLLANLAAIGSALRTGTWEPGPLRRATIAKSDGGQRVLHIPPLVDRVAERAIAAVLTVHVDSQLQPDSYGFRPGLGIEDAIGALRERIADGQRWVIRADFEDCFGSVRVEQCLSELAAAVDDRAVLELVAKAARRSVGERVGVGVAQGSPLSPVLVNHFLDGLDRAGWDEGVSVIRDVDDIAVAASSRAEAERQLAVLRRLAKQRGLTLTPHKTRIVRATEGVDFLGAVVRAGAASPGARLADPARATVHITRRGSALRASGARFVVTGSDRNFRHPAGRTRMIVCADRVLITSAALSLAARSGVGLVVVDSHHEHTVFLSPNSGRYEVLRAQYAAQDDTERSRALAAAMVRAKIANGRTLLTRTKSRRDALPQPAPARLDRLRDHCANATTIAGLHGIEGAASRIYFDALRTLIPADWGFARRNRRPPRDPVNAMLSYCYTILAAEARHAVELAGLDPTRGFLHTSHRARPSLALDLMEEFRALIVDTTILRIIATRAVKPTGFTVTDNGCRMDQPTKRVVIEALERRLLTRVIHPIRRTPMSYRDCIEHQAVLLANALVTGGAYQPMLWR